ncbi:DUF1654 domain-containing protein [Pseudomonas sp. SWRI107]|uniref:DUF1654 domain-containing protein n=1 Tax=Pseudomonas farsensis TaxID=2745492 RepID=UPI0016471E3E|nr:DUF1654 domain-containing protein [Pseudomonas farsensis]MBV4530979.1 DUF1654 domain-containing protein [Pseudomonas farsensis]
MTVDLNRPIAQAQRWVTIHRLDTGEDMAWEQAMELAAETPELDMTLNDHGSVTVRREAENAVDREDLAGEKDW